MKRQAESNNQAGFGVLEVLLVIVVLGVIAFVGWRMYQANQTVSQASESQNQPAAPASHATEAAKTVPQITSSNDLDTVNNMLDTTQVDDTATSDIDTQLNF